jgi:hypothetical protein
LGFKLENLLAKSGAEMRPTLAFFTTDDLRVRLCTSRLDELFLSYFELLVKGEIWYADALQLLNHTFLLTID